MRMMQMNSSMPRSICGLVLALTGILASTLLPALPEDASQPIVGEAGSSELYLGEGLIIYRGTPDNPARISQGSIMIQGTEIRIERGSDGALRQLTATGTPARFQQQPEADQELIYANGLTLIFDNNSQILKLVEEAEFIQAGNTLSGQVIEYNVNARRANASSSSTEDPVRMFIPPVPADE